MEDYGSEEQTEELTCPRTEWKTVLCGGFCFCNGGVRAGQGLIFDDRKQSPGKGFNDMLPLE